MIMKRRMFGLLATTSFMTLKAAWANAQSAVDASLLTKTLTPTGAERAGNADGSIPAWTGGYTTLPAGWQPGTYMPDFFASEQPVVVINSSNMSQYTDKLSEGTVALMQRYGFSIKVYPTHRTAAAPQWVYDNVAANAKNATLDPQGGRFGFIGAWGGVPFPIPDASDPKIAGIQVIWNHLCRWNGKNYFSANCAYVVNNGGLVLASINQNAVTYPYYQSSDFGGVYFRDFDAVTAPANLVGGENLTYDFTDGPTESWLLLNGQGRVRKAPEVAFDTPSNYTDGVSNYDEYYGFNGSPIKYDWTLVGKKEVYVPYNNNGLCLPPASAVHQAHFLDPDVTRWELHRVWVVDAVLHPGERNVLARRRFYIDEDTWTVCHVDAWDANNNLYKVNTLYNQVRPDLPGTVLLNSAVTNLQTGDYATISGPWNEKVHSTVSFPTSYPTGTFDPENMAAASQY